MLCVYSSVKQMPTCTKNLRNVHKQQLHENYDIAEQFPRHLTRLKSLSGS